MNVRLLLLITTFTVIPTCVMAEGCDVQTQSSSASVSAVETHSCYEYEGMPVNSIDWSCSNESKDMLSSTKTKVDHCADHYQATCIATITQESLANPALHQQRQKRQGAEHPRQRPSDHVLLRRGAFGPGAN